MDILIHTLSGLTSGAVVAAFTTDTSLSQKGRIAAIGAFGGALPDIDVISMWSGFDATFGSWFGLASNGREIYFGKFWYSHHVFMHSLLGDLFMTLLLLGALWMYDRRRKKGSFERKEFLKKRGAYLLAFGIGFFSHLVGDMPTPGGPWGGVNLWFPLSTFTGGLGWTWWWNNYDVFLILLTTSVITITILIFQQKNKSWLKWISLAVMCCAIGLSTYQLSHRGIDYNDRGNIDSPERQSLKKQREILGEPLYKIMVKLDHVLPMHF